MILLWLLLIGVGTGMIVWGAETFAKHLGRASVGLGVSAFALALLLAGAEPEELATAVTAALKEVPAIALGDVIGANIAICLVAMGVGAWITPLPFGGKVMPYGLGGLMVGIIAVFAMWDGLVDRWEGIGLVSLYVLYVAVIWWQERHPPALGELEELEEAEEELAQIKKKFPFLELGLVLAGVGGMVLGSVLLVEAAVQITQIETEQTKLALSVVGFATAFELVVLAWSSARRGVTEAAVAGVVGSFAYNVTMTLGTAAIIRPLRIVDAPLLHLPLLFMLAGLGLVLLLALPHHQIDRRGAVVLLCAYPLFLLLLFYNP